MAIYLSIGDVGLRDLIVKAKILRVGMLMLNIMYVKHNILSNISLAIIQSYLPLKLS